ncbi:uncharacterized protein IUM83_11540 [Phytophthora cinnamomi]|uniref:uncharacterized protein n=1 Tax=Phytophthora cinnamomi TaxID=4785 RepID=UPI00355AB40B|nr:hypothetical protein IUM83_11540 [Phytophthora cinnamomi]
MSPVARAKTALRSGKSKRVLKSKTKNGDAEDEDPSEDETASPMDLNDAPRDEERRDKSREGPVTDDEAQTNAPGGSLLADPWTAKASARAPGTATSPRSMEMEAIAATLRQLITIVAGMQPAEAPARGNEPNEERAQVDAAASGADGHEGPQVTTAAAVYTDAGPTAPVVPETSGTNVTAHPAAGVTPVVPASHEMSTMGGVTATGDWNAVTAVIQELVGRIDGLQAAASDARRVSQRPEVDLTAVAAALQKQTTTAAPDHAHIMAMIGVSSVAAAKCRCSADDGMLVVVRDHDEH